MKITYDNIADAMYIRMGKGKIAKTVKMQGRLIVDINKAGKVVGIEILDASSQIPKRELGKIDLGLPISV
ncbi:MAG TPA: DUF2283 domain-containing protein [Candidatus Yonathbacteria bacterium]|nr:DUF2283 domain-containing protein [Candidatus Yonathbacteria bacterium]